MKKENKTNFNEKNLYHIKSLRPEVGVLTAEEEYVSQEQLDEFEEFVTKVQNKFKLKTRAEASAKASELIRQHQNKISQSKDSGKSL